ncbi:RNA-guided endonuclease TnpB family protein [Actinokineospora iranica]|uniref:Putative transposase n=1 Tax=Actinokineospora iranica TaxID=1271860 RepID=A0A1G6QZG4_9PSEU|nr:RNA-guided endonuclease TnpB family protein [Actinokineospora iranica]SDC97800.1 putative transposase [Actinokineospora iranica]
MGGIRTSESTRKLARRLDSDTARVLSATVRRERGGRWFVAFQCEVQRTDRPARNPEAVVGVDLGVSMLAVTSRGRFHPNPRHLAHAEKELRSACRALSRRQGPDVRTGQHPSGRWEAARNVVARRHVRVADLRRDGLHKLTTGLARGFGTLVVEDLNVAGMLRNRRLARQIADAGFGEFRRQLTYKTSWRGGELVVADRWLPSSKTCSGCGWVNPKLRLSDRIYRCKCCGLVLDRDLNAARNLRQYVARSGRETVNGRGADQKTTRARVAGGVETSTNPSLTRLVHVGTH